MLVFFWADSSLFWNQYVYLNFTLYILRISQDERHYSFRFQVSFAIVKTKERGFSETHPQAQVVGLAYDRSLGGLDLQLSIQGMIADR